MLGKSCVCERVKLDRWKKEQGSFFFTQKKLIKFFEGDNENDYILLVGL